VISRALNPTRQVALTIDDGYCRECIAGYVAFAQRTGIHLTFSPNGRFGELWRPHTAVLRPLIANGQVQFGNHTWSHPDLLRANDATVRTEIQRNEDWIEKSFGITARPYFGRPTAATTDGSTISPVPSASRRSSCGAARSATRRSRAHRRCSGWPTSG
jgi:peptidoglycan/xylan/chitin deacetylase (PgdA/CDA1 family)